MTDFWSRARVGSADECWPWAGARFTRGGYGAVRHDGKTMRANRVAWIITNGPIPDGLLVLHRCDNPPCVNPAHLWLGTHGDNARDRAAKGRGRNGRAEQTHCHRGHALEGDNVRYRPSGGRECRVCRRFYYYGGAGLREDVAA